MLILREQELRLYGLCMIVGALRDIAHILIMWDVKSGRQDVMIVHSIEMHILILYFVIILGMHIPVKSIPFRMWIHW